MQLVNFPDFGQHIRLNPQLESCPLNSLPRGPQSGSEASTTILAMAAPGPPQQVNASRLALALRVAWQRPSDDGTGYAAGGHGSLLAYEVQLLPASGGGGAVPVATSTVGPGAASALLVNLTRGLWVTVLVRARNAAGPGPYAGPTSGAVLVIGLPSAPGAVVADTGLIGGPRLAAEWAGARDTGDGGNGTVPADYTLEVASDPAFSPGAVVVIDAGAALLARLLGGVDLALVPGAVYYLRVSAANDVGAGPFSPVTSRRIVGAPSAPLACLLAIAGPGDMRLTWAPPEDLGAGAGVQYPLLGYDVAIFAGAGSPGAGWPPGGGGIVNSTLPSASGWFLAGLTKSNFVRAAVRARNDAGLDAGGCGPWAAAAGACPGNASLSCGALGLTAVYTPSAPLDFALAHSVVDPRALAAQWMVPNDTGDGTPLHPLLRYELNISAAGGPAQLLPVPPSSGSSITQCTTPEYPLGSTRIASVRAVNEAGPGDWSAAAQAIVLLLPNAPSNLTLISSGVSTLNLSFAPPTQTGLGNSSWPLVEYQYQLGGVCGSSILPNELTSFGVLGCGCFVQIPNAQKGCIYTVRLRARNEAGWGNFSVAISRIFLVRATAPTNFQVSNGAALQILVSWSPPNDVGDGNYQTESLVLYYMLQIAKDSLFTIAVQQYSIVSQNSFSVEGLEYGVLLFCRIAAVTAEGTGLFAVRSIIPTFPPLLASSVELSSNLTGATVSVSVSFQTSSVLGSFDVICVTFPTGFTILNATFYLPTGNGFGLAHSKGGISFPCGYNCNSSIEAGSVFVFRDNGPVLPKGSTVTFSLLHIVNRPWAGNAGLFQIRTLNPSGNVTIDANLNISCSSIMAGQLNFSSFYLSSYMTGATTYAFLLFSLSSRNSLVYKGFFNITLPLHEFVTSNFGATIQESNVGKNISSLLYIEGQNIILRNQGSEIKAGSRISIVFAGLRNRITAGPTGPISIQLLNPDGTIADVSMNSPEQMIDPGDLSNASITLNDTTALSLASYRISFECGAVGLPLNSFIKVIFPQNILLDDAYISADEEYSLQAMVTGNSLIISRKLNTSVQAFRSVDFQIHGIRNYFAGYSGTFRIETWQRELDLVMEHCNVSGISFTLIPLVIDALPSNPYAGAEGSINFKVQMKSSLNADVLVGGKIRVIFPPGYYCYSDAIITTNPNLDAQANVNNTFNYKYSYLADGSFVQAGYPCPKGGEAIDFEESWFACSTALTIEWFGLKVWTTSVPLQIFVSSCINVYLSGDSGFFSAALLGHNDLVVSVNVSSNLFLKPLFLPNVNISFSTVVPDTQEELIISAVALSGIPKNCVMVLVTPSEFRVSSDLSLDFNYYPDNKRKFYLANVQIGILENIITINTSAPDFDVRGTVVNFTLKGLKTIDSVGSSGVFTFTLQNLEGVNISYNNKIVGPYLHFWPGIVNTINLFNSPKAGDINISLSGSNFGESKRNRDVLIGGSSCKSTVWTSETSLICTTMGGAKGGSILVTVQNLVSSAFSSITFDTCSLSSVEIGNSPSRGILQWQSIYGTDFGVVSLSPSGNVGVSSCESSEWISDCRMFCKASPALIFVPSISVTSAISFGSITTVMSLDSPTVSALTRLNSGAALPSKFLLTGYGMGSFDASKVVRDGYSVCEFTLWLSDSSIIAKYPVGQGISMRLTMSSSQEVTATLTDACSHDISVLSTLSKVNLPIFAQSISFFVGSNFGTSAKSST